MTGCVHLARFEGGRRLFLIIMPDELLCRILWCPEKIIRLPDEGTVVEGMLVGVMSDTHDDIVQTKKAVSRFNCEGV